MKEHDTNPQDQKSEEEKVYLIQSDDSKDDPKSYKQNGGRDK